jgi:hypothetical protein
MTVAYQNTRTEESAFDQAEGVFSATMAEMKSPEAMKLSHVELEQLGLERATEMARLLIQGHLDMRAAQEQRGAVTGADGKTRTQARSSRRKLQLVVGGVVVERLLYQVAGGTGLCPQDGALNLPEDSFSMGVRRRVAEEAAQGSFDRVVASLAATTRAEVAKRQAEELAAAAAVDFTEYYATREPDAEPADALLVLTFDAAGVVMRVESLRATTRKAAEADAGAPKHWPARLGTGEKANRKRMAAVAAVYGRLPHPRTADDVLGELNSVRGVTAERPKTPRPRPANKRVWASLERGAATVIREGFEDAKRRDPTGRRRWVVLVDGQAQQLRMVRRAAKKAGVEVTIICDLIHVLEYLWDAAHCFYAPGSDEAREWVASHTRRLLEGADASQVAAGMRRSATLRNLENRKKVDLCADYLQKLRPYLRYGDALRDGLPIATGVIEGACRHVIRDRMCRTGARWSTEGAEAVLKLRSLAASGDFDAYWNFHLAREHHRNHVSRYADGIVPNPAHPHLTLVRA